MVDGGGLENHWTGNRSGGSTPSPSAILFSLAYDRRELQRDGALVIAYLNIELRLWWNPSTWKVRDPHV